MEMNGMIQFEKYRKHINFLVSSNPLRRTITRALEFYEIRLAHLAYDCLIILPLHAQSITIASICIEVFRSFMDNSRIYIVYSRTKADLIKYFMFFTLCHYSRIMSILFGFNSRILYFIYFSHLILVGQIVSSNTLP